jgi:F-type H+-transporting ATPase subunit epsilon
MSKTFQLEIVTPERVEVSMPVTSIRAPALGGYVGILANHAPMVSTLDVGEIRIRVDDTETLLATSGGFLEVSNNVCTVLADSIEHADKIDIDRAEQAMQRARERLATGMPDADQARAEAALKRAVNRLRVAKEGHNGP